ncbi:MAG TPA: threonine synthase [Thermoanaerobaculia bacterium]|nr:threonine synthase [Thermoanaerobaculia bacterium]
MITDNQQPATRRAAKAARRFSFHLECSACATRYDPDQLINLCRKCGAPLLVQYDLSPAPELRDEIKLRQPTMWRYAEVLPGEDPVTLGEGITPLLQSDQFQNVWIKDESKNPTRSFKSRGMAAAVTMAARNGAKSVAAPTAGNAGAALSAYGARAGLPVFVAMPKDTPKSIVDECRSYGAEVELVAGLITDAGKRVQQYIAANGGFDLSTLKEPYRVEGKKIMGYELLEDLGRLPDVILYPTGGGTGLIGMWKAFGEMERLGWIGKERPRMYSVQSSGCAPVVRAFEKGLESAPEWENAQTIAWGLRVPRAIGDRLMLRALRESNGGAIAVDEKNIESAASEMRTREGIDSGPEGGAALLALRRLIAEGAISEADTVVLFNTGGNKYHW